MPCRIFLLFFLFAIVDAQAQTWNLETIIQDTSRTVFEGDGMGSTVDTDGDFMVVSAPLKEESKGFDLDTVKCGVVMVYKRDTVAQRWVLVQRIRPEVYRTFNRSFGVALILKGKTLIIGDSKSDATETSNIGEVYVYRLTDVDTFKKIQTIRIPELSSYSLFGHNIKMVGNTLFLSNILNNINRVGDTVRNIGVIYVYERNSFGEFYYHSSIYPPDNEDFISFGEVISGQRNYLMVGIPNMDNTSGGDNINDAGSVAIYRRDENRNWSFYQTLRRSVAEERNSFGNSVSAGKSGLIISASPADSGPEIFRYLQGQDSMWHLVDTVHIHTSVIPDRNTRIQQYGNLIVVGDPYAGPSVYQGRIYMYQLVEDQMILSHVFENPSPKLSTYFGLTYSVSEHGLSVGIRDEGQLQNNVWKEETGAVYFYSMGLCSLKNQTESLSICDEFISPSKIHTWTEDGKYLDTSFVNGCKYAYEFDLSFRQSSYKYFDSTICGVFIAPSGNFTSESGVFFDTITNAVGCDSVMEFKLLNITPDASIQKSQNILDLLSDSAVQIQWVDCGNSNRKIKGETGSRFIVIKEGLYAAQVTRDNCTVQSTCFYISSEEIQEPGSVRFELNPNPARDFIRIYLSRDIGDFDIDIYSVSGERVISITRTYQKTFDINIEISPGVYFLRISNGSDFNRWVRFVKI